MPGSVLVTGASGFVGPWLLAAIAERGWGPITALGEPPADPVPVLEGGAAAKRREGAPAVTWRPGDVRDAAAVDALVAEVKPARVFHLAAQASVAASLEDPGTTFEINALGTLRLLDALRRHAPTARTLLVSSAEVYGPRGGRLAEDLAPAPANPYAASKAAAEQVAAAFARAYGLAVVVARPFNHTGPGQSARFAPGAFARQIAMIESGRQAAVIRVGNLEARRDFLDVRDVVRAYLALAEHGEPGRAYNVCRGEAVAIQAILDGLLAHAKVGIDVEPDAGLMRPSDVPELVGEPAALQAATGWAAEIPLATTLADLLDDWRRRMPFFGDVASHLA